MSLEKFNNNLDAQKAEIDRERELEQLMAERDYLQRKNLEMYHRLQICTMKYQILMNKYHSLMDRANDKLFMLASFCSRKKDRKRMMSMVRGYGFHYDRERNATDVVIDDDFAALEMPSLARGFHRPLLGEGYKSMRTEGGYDELRDCRGNYNNYSY